MGGLFIASGLLLFGGGIGAIVYGWPYLVLEYGFTIVIAGAVAASCGLILFGIGLVLRAVRRLGERLAREIADRLPPAPAVEVPAAEAPTVEVPPAKEQIAGELTTEPESDRSAETGLSDTPEPIAVRPDGEAFEQVAASEPATEPAPPPTGTDEGIVRTYTVGDASFTMYANGTVKAETPEGVETFATVDELRRYLATRMNKAN